MKKGVIVGALSVIGWNAGAQVLNGVYVKEHIPTKKLIVQQSVVERDVMWEKRVWRIIDTREKINMQFYYPLESTPYRSSLYDIIRENVLNKSITAYYAFNESTLTDYGGDQFLFPLSKTDAQFAEKAKAIFSVEGAIPTTPIQTLDKFGNIVDSVISYNRDGTVKEYAYPPRACYHITAKDIVGWELKEDWFFDKTRSVMDVRIIGIAPIVNYEDPNTGQKIIRRLCWLYFPELRYVLQNYPTFNRQNDAQQISFLDVFEKRYFNSYITKESNIFDRMITDYLAGVDALLESDRIKNKLEQTEHDVWDL